MVQQKLSRSFPCLLRTYASKFFARFGLAIENCFRVFNGLCNRRQLRWDKGQISLVLLGGSCSPQTRSFAQRKLSFYLSKRLRELCAHFRHFGGQPSNILRCYRRRFGESLMGMSKWKS